MNRLISFLCNRSKLSALRAEAAHVDAEFERLERRVSAELHAIRTRRAIESSERVLSWEMAPAHVGGRVL